MNPPQLTIQPTGDPEVDKILSDVRTSYREKHAARYSISYGSKQMSISFRKQSRVDRLFGDEDFITFLSTVKGNKRAEGETTRLYTAAREIMRQIATETRQTLKYSLRTSNPRMIWWAENIGPRVFEKWRTKLKNTLNEPKMVGKTRIRPKHG